jgi:hypothetical protein
MMKKTLIPKIGWKMTNFEEQHEFIKNYYYMKYLVIEI